MGLRILLYGETFYYSSKGVNKGFVFIEGDRITDIGVEAPPEYELSELLLKYDKPALITHGFSAIIPGPEFAFRGLEEGYERIGAELFEKSIEASISIAISNGITLPILVDDASCKATAILSRLQVRGVTITPEPCSRPGVLNILLDRAGNLFYNGNVIGNIRDVVCSPGSVSEKCLFLDTRSEHSRNVESWLTKSNNPRILYEILVKPYRILRLDNGFVDVKSLSDILVYDLSDPLLSIPISRLDPVAVAMRGRPQVVIVGGDIAYEKGEYLLAIPPRIIDYLV
ncbi:hypothetical protein ACSU1N_04580 [Thermogladius sp. 4427co]|uniref:hypothetical protein n=1 Tax=Thermogladius sp. 4427co TaxID=3450718 RepID=UPI003F7B283D